MSGRHAPWLAAALGCWLGLGASSMAVAWQSCPQPQGYAQAAPILLTPPGSLGSPVNHTMQRAVSIPGGYRPADLLGWTTSTSVCTSGSSADAPCGAHRVYVPAAGVTPREPLVVFLPGSSMTPSEHDLVLKTAAYAGYRTIGLSYDSTNNVDKICAPFAGFGIYPFCANDCYATKRDEIILGRDLTQEFTVEPADSIVERLFTLLAQLYADDISDGTNDHEWDSYFSPLLTVPVRIGVGNLEWDKIIIAGFSQGAGHAARMSRAYPVHGTVMIDGPGDMCLDGFELAAAPWLNGPDASAGRPRYGAMHGLWIDEFGLAEGEAPPTWQAMGIADGGLVSLDGVAGDGLRSSSVPELGGNLLIDIAQWILPPAPAAYTEQIPASSGEVDERCPDIPIDGMPDGASQMHGSMAADSCMPTSLTDGLVASTPPEAYLFPHYLKRFCYACEQAVCP